MGGIFLGHKNMKKAFTLLELVIVIIIIGVLALVALPRFKRDRLGEAAAQIASHIRHTQHLALQDDKIVDKILNNNNNWFKKFWRISFNMRGNDWTYSVYSDKQGDSTGNPNSIDEIAVDPSNPNKKLTAGFGNSISSNLPAVNSKLNLTKTYKISNVTLINCNNGGQQILFDNIGRPYSSTSGVSQTESFFSKLIKSTNENNPGCVIKLTNSQGYINIIVYAETGYIKVCKKNEDVSACK